MFLKRSLCSSEQSRGTIGASVKTSRRHRTLIEKNISPFINNFFARLGAEPSRTQAAVVIKTIDLPFHAHLTSTSLLFDSRWRRRHRRWTFNVVSAITSLSQFQSWLKYQSIVHCLVYRALFQSTTFSHPWVLIRQFSSTMKNNVPGYET